MLTLRQILELPERILKLKSVPTLNYKFYQTNEILSKLIAVTKKNHTKVLQLRNTLIESKTHLMGSIIDWRGQRTESVNLENEQKNLLNQNRENMLKK